MCLAIAGKVDQVEGRKVVVSYPNGLKSEAVLGSESVAVGSYVMVQMGVVTRVFSEGQAQAMWEAWGVSSPKQHK